VSTDIGVTQTFV